MRLSIIAVGRLKAGPERALVDTYAARLEGAPGRLGPLTVREIDDRKLHSHADTQTAFAGHRAPGGRAVALDERGRSLTTHAFADLLARWRDDGVPETAFLIGGADGLPAAVRDGADLTLCLGTLTWPHMLARVLIAEQLYRAASVLAGHPYHRD